ncbi:MAG: glycerophosphodiester phosphodiesterase family protein [Pseudomonadota bacterium]
MQGIGRDGQVQVEQIEVDGQLSADGVPVIFHDAKLDRVTDRIGPLAARSAAELKALNIFQGGGLIMTLDEELEILAPSGLTLRCEDKPGVDLAPYPRIVDKVFQALAPRRLVERTVLTSFHLPTLRQVLDRAPALSDVIWLVSDQIVRPTSPDHVAMLAAAVGVGAVSLHHKVLDDRVLAVLRDAGLRVVAFGVLEDEGLPRSCTRA